VIAIRRRRARQRESLVERVPVWRGVLAWVVALVAFFPVLYIFVTGFKSEQNALALPPTIIPTAGGGFPLTFQFTTENYAAILAPERNFVPFFTNSVVTVVISGILVMLLAIPCAFALSWKRRGRNRDILFFFLSTKFLPAVGVIVPLFVIARDLKLIDQPVTLIIMYTSMNLPIAIWMLRSFFDEVPRDVLDACQVDGANTRQEMFSVALPMITPGLVATVFICAIFAWNEFFFALNLVATRAATVPLFMIGFETSEGLFWAKLAAAGTMAMLPVVLVGWAAQRSLVRGLSMGAVK
jgi:sorbitol/mannitol transport system permease protein